MTTSQSEDFLSGLTSTKSSIERMVAHHCKNTVQTGPFTGLILPETEVDSIAPKLLGCYEAELHEAIEQSIEIQPDIIVNIGCAEGFYAVGLARRLPSATCFAFDCLEEEQARCRHTASVNKVESSVRVAGSIEKNQLDRCLKPALTPLIVCDCEGCELELLDPATVPELSKSRIIVELHDRPGTDEIRRTLLGRFQESHTIQVVRSGARDPGAFSVLSSLNQFLQFLAICEFRDWTMEWTVMNPITPNN